MFYNELSYFEKTEGVPARIYYHYTSVAALFEIVKHRTLWLMNLKSSNDRRELSLTFSAYCEKLKQLQDKFKDDVNLGNFITQLFMGGERYHNEITKLRRATTEAYALSLVNKSDNLLHWNSYAEKGTGVCIGFNVRAFDVYISRMALHMIGDNLLDRGKVLYGEAACLEEMENILRHYYDMSIHDEQTKQLWQKTEHMGFVTLWIAFNRIRNFLKHESFHDESEYRLFFTPYAIGQIKYIIKLLKQDLTPELSRNISNHFTEFIDKLEIKNRYFTLARGEIRSYHKINLSEIWGQGVLPEIIIGPKCTQNIRELRDFLRENGLHKTKLTQSEIPLR